VPPADDAQKLSVLASSHWSQTMQKPIRWSLFGVCAALVLFLGRPAAALPPPRAAQVEKQKEILRSVFEKMPRARLRVLSGGALNLAEWAREDVEHEGPEERPARRPAAREAEIAAAEHHDHDHDRIRVNDPSTDFTLSIVAGFTQSETSTAWCGNTVVVGFNDSGSILETLPTPRGLSFNGVARSTNRGRSFTDLGFLNPGPDFFSQLGGDPVLACSSSTRFQYSSIFLAFSGLNPVSGMSVSTSTDGGATWGDPVLAVGKDINLHFLDKDWMAIDPNDPNRVYLTYTDFGNFDADPGCPQDFATSIELVRSTDGGLTWSSPTVLELVCGGDAVQGSQVIVGPSGDVNVAWERLPQAASRAQAFRHSTDRGITFSPTVLVSDVTCVGDCFALQGGFRSGFEFPMLAVDRSDKPTAGNLYLAWHDGRNKQVPDEGAPLGVYGYADILVSRSTDGGATWSAPVTANRDRASGETDQYQPAIAVDRRGRIAVCYYDRSLDPDNFKITRSCSRSKNAGEDWSFERITDRKEDFIPFHADDAVVNPFYMGDYDSLAADTLLGHSGFVGGFLIEEFHGNQNVFANRVGID
jgi:hypothetical protein